MATDDPEQSFTKDLTAAQAGERRRRDAREVLRVLVVGSVLFALGALLGVRVLAQAVQSQQAAAMGDQNTGWVGTDGQGNPVSVTIEPCQHAPCFNVAVQVTLLDAPHLQGHYLLGGSLLNERELYVSGNYHDSLYTADILCSDPVNGSVTSGTATMTLLRGDTTTQFQMHAATLQQQGAVFDGL